MNKHLYWPYAGAGLTVPVIVSVCIAVLGMPKPAWSGRVPERLGALPVLGRVLGLHPLYLCLFVWAIDYGAVVLLTLLENGGRTIRIPDYLAFWLGDAIVMPVAALMGGILLHMPHLTRPPQWLHWAVLGVGVMGGLINEGAHIKLVVQRVIFEQDLNSWADLRLHKVWHGAVFGVMVYWFAIMLCASWPTIWRMANPRVLSLDVALLSCTVLIVAHLSLMVVTAYQATRPDYDATGAVWQLWNQRGPIAIQAP